MDEVEVLSTADQLGPVSKSPGDGASFLPPETKISDILRMAIRKLGVGGVCRIFSGLMEEGVSFRQMPQRVRFAINRGETGFVDGFRIEQSSDVDPGIDRTITTLTAMTGLLSYLYVFAPNEDDCRIEEASRRSPKDFDVKVGVCDDGGFTVIDGALPKRRGGRSSTFMRFFDTRVDDPNVVENFRIQFRKYLEEVGNCDVRLDAKL